MKQLTQEELETEIKEDLEESDLQGTSFTSLPRPHGPCVFVLSTYCL